jgi:hypothetical protein
MKIEISQYKPSVIRKVKRSNAVLGRWWEGFNGIELFGERLIGISLHRNIVLSDKPFKDKYDNLSLYVYILTWPINIDIRWNKRPSNFKK